MQIYVQDRKFLATFDVSPQHSHFNGMYRPLQITIAQYIITVFSAISTKQRLYPWDIVFETICIRLLTKNPFHRVVILFCGPTKGQEIMTIFVLGVSLPHFRDTTHFYARRYQRSKENSMVTSVSWRHFKFGAKIVSSNLSPSRGVIPGNQ